MRQLERPPDLLARRAQAEEKPSERQADDHRAGGVGQRLDLRDARLAPRSCEAERLQAQDRKDAGHQVQDQSAEDRSEEHTSELQSLMRISYAVFCLKKKTYSTI